MASDEVVCNLQLALSVEVLRSGRLGQVRVVNLRNFTWPDGAGRHIVPEQFTPSSGEAGGCPTDSAGPGRKLGPEIPEIQVIPAGSSGRSGPPLTWRPGNSRISGIPGNNYLDFLNVRPEIPARLRSCSTSARVKARVAPAPPPPAPRPPPSVYINDSGDIVRSPAGQKRKADDADSPQPCKHFRVSLRT